MKKFFLKQAPLVGDGDDLGSGSADRGDEVVIPKEAPITADEKKLADDLKAGEEAEAKKAAALADAKGDEEEDDPDNPGKKRKKDSRIPVSRHKEILEAERAERARLEARLAQFERGQDVAETNKELNEKEEALVKLEGEHAKLIADNKTEEAGKLMTQIRRAEREITETRAELREAAAEARAYERARYDTTVDRVEAAYPELRQSTDENPNEEYNPAKVKKVLSIARAYQLDGMTPSAALQEAVKDLLGAPKNKAQEVAVEVKPRVTDAEAKKAAREEEARKTALAAAGKTPANEKPGKDSDMLGGSLAGVDVMKMSQRDFASLDEATLSRMRGDEVA